MKKQLQPKCNLKVMEAIVATYVRREYTLKCTDIQFTIMTDLFAEIVNLPKKEYGAEQAVITVNGN